MVLVDFTRFGMRSIGKILLRCAGKECPCTVTEIRHRADDEISIVCTGNLLIKMSRVAVGLKIQKLK